jgi:hypothetical protein
MENKADYLTRTNNGTVFAGSDMGIFQALVLASGLRIYAATGMKPNRQYTPSAMLNAAKAVTGKTYKRGEYAKAADDLTEWANARKGEPRQAA